MLLVTLDTLRYDVAREEAAAGRTPFLASILPGGAWEERHAPGSFTYASHHAFFGGFLPTPIGPGPHPRLFALEFPGSESVDERTRVFASRDLPAGFRDCGYRTVCVGGVGFFNGLGPLGSVLPDLFDEAVWTPELGVTSPDSTARQVRWAVERVERATCEEPGRPLFLFVNVSAIHQPNRFYLEGAAADSLDSHAAALRYVDRQLPPLFAALRRRGPLLAVLTSDHGTAYGEDGYLGHRLAHPVVWTVPYAEMLLPAARRGGGG